MSKSTYKKAMIALSEKQRKQRMADDVKTVPFIPSKDFKIERKPIKRREK